MYEFILILFIHYVNLYSASSRLLLRSAPESSMAKKSSFKARVQFIHFSFIPAISTAPLQVLYYSETLPTTARILYWSFTPKNVSKWTMGSNRSTNGSPFQTEGPTTENAQVWQVEVRAKETKSTPPSH